MSVKKKSGKRENFVRVSFTVRASDEVRLKAEARRLSRIFEQSLSNSQVVRYLLERLPEPCPDSDPDLFSEYLKAIDSEDGKPAIDLRK